jgi:hypothetical protein
VRAASVPDSSGRGWFLPVRVWRQLFAAAIRLTAIGLIAIGVSGLVAGGMALALGKSFVAGDPPEITYSADRCADYFEYEPHAGTCEEAATLHHFGEVVTYRWVAGVLGLLLLGGHAVVRRRWTWMRDRAELPDGFEATVGAAVFGVAAAALLGQSLETFAAGETAGVGDYLSGGVVSAMVALVFGLSLYRTLAGRVTSAPTR